MKSVLTCIIIFLLFIGGATASAQPVGDKPQSVGLVLSGGGAKGIAHIGVIKALEDNDIPIDYISGTSMGAIVGGLYASGYTTEEMMQLIMSQDFSYWSTGKIDPKKVYYFARQEPSPALFSLPVNLNDSTTRAQELPASLINPLPMNFAFMNLFAPYTAQCGGDFNRLFVPFRCVSSDVDAGHKVVLSSGDLGDAIRTSMSFPLVFQPIKVNGQLLYDGGIFDNFPVDVMTTDFAPDFTIGVVVSAASTGPQTSLMDQVENLVMRKQDYEVPAEKGVKIRVNLQQFGLLDFPQAQRIYKLGYDKAMSMIDSIKGRVTSRMPKVARATARRAFKAKTPYLRFDSLSVSGGTPKQDKYIEYMFKPAHADTFGISHVRQSYFRAISPGRLRDLFPRAVYNDSTDMFALNLRATPKDNFSLSMGGYITSATNSFLYASASYKTLSFSSMSADFHAWVGQSYMAAMLSAAINLRTVVPSAVSFLGVASRSRFYENEHMFYEDKVPTFIIGYEHYMRLNYELAARDRGKFTMSLGFGHIADSFYRSNSDLNYKLGRDNTYSNLGQFRAAYNSSTLDDITYPTSGYYYKFAAIGAYGKYHYKSADKTFNDNATTEHWGQIEARTRNYFDVAKHFSFGIEGDILASTRKLKSNYSASLVDAPAYYPTPMTYNTFNPAFRANSFVGVGLVPIYKYNSSISARMCMHAFVPMRSIVETEDGGSRYSNWFAKPKFFGELDLCYNLPFNATLSAYLNYASTASRNWNVGLSLGVFILAPKYLR
jgi:NTE family protein